MPPLYSAGVRELRGVKRGISHINLLHLSKLLLRQQYMSNPSFPRKRESRSGWDTGSSLAWQLIYLIAGVIISETPEIKVITQGSVGQITNNTNFGKIGNLLSRGHERGYIFRHYHMDLPPVT